MIGFDWRGWAAAVLVVVIGGLAVWGVNGARLRSEDRVVTLGQAVERADRDRDAAIKRATAAEARLADYSAQSLAAFRGQVEAAQRSAAALEQINRRAVAAHLELQNASGDLRLDDPLPRGLRDAVACAGTASACAPAAAADPGGVPSGASEPGRKAGRGSGKPDRAAGAGRGR